MELGLSVEQEFELSAVRWMLEKMDEQAVKLYLICLIEQKFIRDNEIAELLRSDLSR